MNNGKKGGGKAKKKAQTNEKVKVAVSAEFARKKYKDEDNDAGTNGNCQANGNKHKVNKIVLKEAFKKHLNMLGENLPCDSSDSSISKRKRMYIKTYGVGMTNRNNDNNINNCKVRVNELSEAEFKAKITKEFAYSFNKYLKLKLNT